MSLQTVTNINVDFYDKKYIMLNAKQYDSSSRWINVTCYNNGSLMNLSSSKHTAYIRYKKADGNGVLNSCRMNYKGEIMVELTEQMLAADGICYVDLIIVNKGKAIIDIDTGEVKTIDDSEILSTMAFQINVYEAAFDNSLIESSYEYDALNDLFKKAEADYSEVIQLAKSYAMGDADNIRENEDYDNSKYYSQLSRSYAIGDANDVRENENTDNSKYYSELSHASADAADESEAATLSYMNNAKSHMDDAKAAQDAAEIAQGKSETAQSLSETAQQKAETAQGNAEVAQGKAEDAQSLAETAQDKAESAQTAAETAQNLAETALQKANASETNAYNHMNDAKNYAIQSQRYAIGGTGTIDGEDEDNSKYYCNKALESASNVEANADVISNAATIATNQADAAAKSASDAASSADLASDSADLASDSANAANVSATSAINSATSATTSATEAYTYLLQVEEITTGLSGAFMPMGTIEFAELATLIESAKVKAGYLYNISDNFTTDETFKRGAGIEYAAGTNVYYTSEGYWDCLASTTVTGIKGDKETEYRKGNVNITVENIGAIPSEDIATVDEIKSFLGI